MVSQSGGAKTPHTAQGLLRESVGIKVGDRGQGEVQAAVVTPGGRSWQ